MTLTPIDVANIPAHLTDVPNELRNLLNGLSGNIADWGLKTLLDVMKLAFEASSLSVVLLFFPSLKGFDESIRNFSGNYAFETKDGLVGVSAIFTNGQMQVLAKEDPAWDVKILFKDVRSFWKFLLAGGNDILDSLLENDVEVYGNLNYLYKFGYMARDLEQRLKLGQSFAA
jgi:hypothetical protein